MFRISRAVVANSTVLRAHRLAHPLLLHRTVASSVTTKPGSQTLPHATTNVKEELGHMATDFAKSLAGGSLNAGDAAAPNKGFLAITSAIALQVPKPVMAFGLAGALPYLGTSITSLYLARQAGLAAAGLAPNIDPAAMMAVLNQCLTIQVTYGAVMLSFLGALHWGFEFSGYGGHQGFRRLALGAAPVLYAWPTLALEPTTALIVQWVGFTALWAADVRASTNGWTPRWYAQYRFYLSLLVGTCIIGTLGGTSYFGPVAGHSWTTHDLRELRAERRRLQQESRGVIQGDVEAIEGEDAYVIIRQQKSDEDAESEDGGDGSDAESEEGGSNEGESKTKGKE